MVNENTTLDELLILAKKATNELNAEEVYMVKDLFRGFEWNRIAKGNRTKLGAMYFAYSKNEGAGIIEPLRKSPQNQQIYRKL